MVNTLDEATRKQVAVFLPELITKTLQSYYDFVSAGPETATPAKTSSKSFSEHHSAGKVALAHLDLLLKLANLADVKTSLSEDDLAHVMKGKEEVNESRGLIVPNPLEKNDECQ